MSSSEHVYEVARSIYTKVNTRRETKMSSAAGSDYNLAFTLLLINRIWKLQDQMGTR
jgi:hypothetical protein